MPWRPGVDDPIAYMELPEDLMYTPLGRANRRPKVGRELLAARLARTRVAAGRSNAEAVAKN